MIQILLFLSILLSIYALIINILWYINRYRKPQLIVPLAGLIIAYVGMFTAFLESGCTIIEQSDPHNPLNTSIVVAPTADYGSVVLSSIIFLVNLLSLMIVLSKKIR